MTERIHAAFAARSYTVTRVQIRGSMATVFLGSKAGVTAGTLHSRFADCRWMRVMGHGYVPGDGEWTVMVKVIEEE